MEREVVVSAQFAAFHQWDTAPMEFAYLRNRHRHLFKVRAWAKVSHNDRDIEFIDLKTRLQKHTHLYYENMFLHNMSCEAIAEDILEKFDELYKVEVMEDGENGAILTRKEQQ